MGKIIVVKRYGDGVVQEAVYHTKLAVQIIYQYKEGEVW
jgi:hypothetical protein